MTGSLSHPDNGSSQHDVSSVGGLGRGRNWRWAVLGGVGLALPLALLFAGWRWYEKSSQSSLILEASDAELVAELLDDRGLPIRDEPLPFDQPITLPRGDYQIRVSKQGTLSRTYDLTLTPSDVPVRYRVAPYDNWLGAREKVEIDPTPLEAEERGGLLVWTHEGVMSCRPNEADHFVPLWLSNARHPSVPDVPGLVWPHDPVRVYGSTINGLPERTPWVVAKAAEFNGDGTADIICAGRQQAWLMALSGQGGELLWFTPQGSDLSEPGTSGQSLASAIGHPPAIASDIDGDAVPDVFTIVVDQGESLTCRRSLVAISGKTGEQLWRYDLAEELFDILPGQTIPHGLRWYAQVSAVSNPTRETQFSDRHTIRQPQFDEPFGWAIYLPDSLHLLANHSQVAVVAGQHLVLLDVTSGELVDKPVDLKVRPCEPVRWADVDGDGSDEFVCVEMVPHPTAPTEIASKLHVWTAHEQKLLWSKTLDAVPHQTIEPSRDDTGWPLLADLDNDGSCEIIVPIARFCPGGNPTGQPPQATPWGELAVLSGRTGEPVWSRKLASMDTQVDRFIVGPDLDGDGYAEVFAATLCGTEPDLYVDALSGVTG